MNNLKIVWCFLAFLFVHIMPVLGQYSTLDSIKINNITFKETADKIYAELQTADTANKEIIAGYYYEIATLSFMLDSEKLQLPRTMAYIDTALKINYTKKNLEFRGFLNLMTKNYIEAVKDFKRVEMLDTTGIAQTWYYISATSFDANDNTTACEYMQKALSKNFMDGLYYVGMACRECDVELSKILKQDLFLQIIYNYLAEDAADYAQEVLKKMQVVYPDNSITYLAKGYYFLYNNNLEASIKELNSAVKLDASNAAAYYLLSRIYLNQHKYKESEKAINAALKTKIDNPSFLLQRARINFNTKDYRSAIRDCSIVKEQDAGCENGAAYLITVMIYLSDEKMKISKSSEICNNLKLAKSFDAENSAIDVLIKENCNK